MADQALADQCMKCDKLTSALFSVNPELHQFLMHFTGKNGFPHHVCMTCYGEMAKALPKDNHFKVINEFKAQHRKILWKERMTLLHQGKESMLIKSYSDAVICYERYLRILHELHQAEPWKLSPEIFEKSEAGQKEIDIVTAVYWDLARIYDHSSDHSAFFERAADQLVSFLRVSKLGPVIATDARRFLKETQNKKIVKRIIQATKRKSKPGMFTRLFSRSKAA